MSRPGALALLATALALAACSSSVEQDQLAAQVAAALEEQAGVRPEVSCAGDLAAKVAATTECTATDPQTGQEFRYEIRVTAVKGDRAEFDVRPVG